MFLFPNVYMIIFYYSVILLFYSILLTKQITRPTYLVPFGFILNGLLYEQFNDLSHVFCYTLRKQMCCSGLKFKKSRVLNLNDKDGNPLQYLLKNSENVFVIVSGGTHNKKLLAGYNKRPLAVIHSQ